MEFCGVSAVYAVTALVNEREKPVKIAGISENIS